MSIHKLERVLWRLRKRNKGQDRLTWAELERAVLYEIGTDRRTYLNAKRALLKLGWIKPHGRQQFEMTGDDLNNV